MGDPRLISVDELRAAGALDVPPEWRKSLSSGKRERTRSLFDEDDLESETQPSTLDEDRRGGSVEDDARRRS